MNEARFTLSPGDMISANRVWYLAAWTSPKYLAVFVLALVFSVALVLIEAPRLDAASIAVAVLIGSAVWFVVLVALIGIILLLLPRQVRRQLKQQRNLQDEIRVVWEPDGILLESAHGNSRFAWDEFHRWAEGSNVFLLFQSDRLFNLIPKRALNDKGIAEVRSFLQRHGPRRLGLKMVRARAGADTV